jgi:hypothetical protein
MSEKIHYRHFTEEEDRVYKKSIEIVRSNIGNGVKFDLACEFINVDDHELKGLIIDDALKIEIAELHYGRRIPLRDVAKKLGVPMERLLQASAEMMEDVFQTSEEAVRKQSGDKGRTTH